MSALIPQYYQNIKLLYKNFSVFFFVCISSSGWTRKCTREHHISPFWGLKPGHRLPGVELWTVAVFPQLLQSTPGLFLCLFLVLLLSQQAARLWLLTIKMNFPTQKSNMCLDYSSCFIRDHISVLAVNTHLHAAIPIEIG